MKKSETIDAKKEVVPPTHEMSLEEFNLKLKKDIHRNAKNAKIPPEPPRIEKKEEAKQ